MRRKNASDQAALNWRVPIGNDPYETCIDRRAFLRAGAGLIGGLALAWPLQELMARQAAGACASIASPYGTPKAKIDQATGLKLLKLPDGFEYWSFGWRGDPLFDGHTTPTMHDGMAVVKMSSNGKYVLLSRNHEREPGPAFAAGVVRYSPGGGGGVTNLQWNTATKQVTKSWVSLSGTVRNCAGGLTPWGTWLSCEEVTTAALDSAGKRHGYVFEVHPTQKLSTNKRRIIAMGRFAHEALAVDPATGIVYMTEDAGSNSGFYRYIPYVPGQLHLGGTLQMLRVHGVKQADLRYAGCGAAYNVGWVTINSVNPSTITPTHPTSVHGQGRALGGARFQRLEGCWGGMGRIYFVSASGGPAYEGQVFEYHPQIERLRVIYASPNQQACENPDHITVTPRGGLLICENNSGATTNSAERLLGLTQDGNIFKFAVNNINFKPGALGPYTRAESGNTFSADYRQKEFAGACYSPDGKWLFVNVQSPGITFAIRPTNGNWGSGPL